MTAPGNVTVRLALAVPVQIAGGFRVLTRVAVPLTVTVFVPFAVPVNVPLYWH